jgi:hypothetical protein
MTVAVAEFLVFVVLPVALVALVGTAFVALGGFFDLYANQSERSDE